MFNGTAIGVRGSCSAFGLFFIFSFVGDYMYIQTSADDVIITQLQVISQVFSSYPLSGLFCQVSKLTIHEENGCQWEKSLFGRNWVEVPQR